MKTVILVVVFDAHFVELSRVARRLTLSNKYKPVFAFVFSYSVIERDLAICRSESWEYVLLASPHSSGKKKWYSLANQILDRFSENISVFVHSVILYFVIQKKIKWLVDGARTLIFKYQPALLILAEDNVAYFSHVLIRVFLSRGVQTVIVPYTIANASEAGEFYSDSSKHIVDSNIVNKLIAKKYPHWVYEHRGKKLLFMLPGEIVALERAGFHYSDPWKINSEETTIIAIENEHMLDYYLNENLSGERLVVTGALYDDVFAEALLNSDHTRKEVYQEHNFFSEKHLLLCALPPDQFPRDCEFRNYDSLVKTWLSSLAKFETWNVIVRPHPRLTAEQIEPFQRFGVRFTTQDTASLVPICDLYLASSSATIRWAIACGKPVINYDVYQYLKGYNDYADVLGVLAVSNKEDFLSTLQRLTTDQDYYDQISHAQRKEMSRWGKLDGKAGERMIRLFDDVIAGKHKEILT
ncbi:MAG: hypothetical protein H8D23_04805 [Candidatus Brocadiales bacterium]|nr:hypothetical protein [Candidatus Brocadiales bacterium]